jgi:membrane protease YdiL (CAAX protease family)
LFSAASGGRAAVVRLTHRLIRACVGARWYLPAIGIPVVEKVAVDLVGTLLGVTTPTRLVTALTASALVVPLVVLVPAMLEELGWRGFGVQTAVERGHSPAWAALAAGAAFLALHVPLYLPGQLYAGLPFWPLPITVLASSLLLTWIYLRTGSVLLTGLMHAPFDATVPLTWGLEAGWAWKARAIILLLITTSVVAQEGLTWWRSPSPSAAGGIPVCSTRGWRGDPMRTASEQDPGCVAAPVKSCTAVLRPHRSSGATP